MHKPSAPQDRGIRSIFNDALRVADATPSWWGSLSTLMASPLSRAVATGAVAGLAVLVVSVGAYAGWALTQDTAAPERTGREIVAKADRLALHDEKFAPLASETSAARRDLLAFAPSVTSLSEDGQSTVALSAVAFAPAMQLDAIGAIDTILERPPIMTASLYPSAGIAAGTRGGIDMQPVIAEDGDDDAIIPLPRARPAYTRETLPLPRPRPNIALASLTADSIPRARTEVLEEAPARAPTQALGFFSSPTEPMRGPTKTIDTPFGVPYVLQTGSVETACLKPELVDILRRVERHYGQKVTITSGFRDRGRQGSLHRQCAAADIEIPGVSADALASYARTIPNIGGVGTYCHQEMIHVDIGTPRDWKYGCGSYFAMRGGVAGKWGKVPASLASMRGGDQSSAED